jgi:hypothetical protein
MVQKGQDWSGYFRDNKQVREWTTYDDQSRIVKVPRMKSPA